MKMKLTGPMMFGNVIRSTGDIVEIGNVELYHKLVKAGKGTTVQTMTECPPDRMPRPDDTDPVTYAFQAEDLPAYVVKSNEEEQIKKAKKQSRVNKNLGNVESNDLLARVNALENNRA